MLSKKHLSGAQKRRKRKLEDELKESQKGAIHKFFSSSRNAKVSQDQGQEHDQPIIAQANVNDGGTEEQISYAQADANEGATEEENLDAQADANEDILGGENLQPSDDTENVNIDDQEDSLMTIFDHRTWKNLDNSKRNILIEKGLVREMDLHFPRDLSNRCF